MSDARKPNSSEDLLRLLMNLSKAQGTGAEILATLRNIEKTANSKLEQFKPEIKAFRDDVQLAVRNLDTAAFPLLLARGHDLANRIANAQAPVKAEEKPTQAAPAQTAPSGDDVVTRLEKLQKLHENKLITDEEYAAKRAAIIAEL